MIGQRDAQVPYFKNVVVDSKTAMPTMVASKLHLMLLMKRIVVSDNLFLIIVKRTTEGNTGEIFDASFIRCQSPTRSPNQNDELMALLLSYASLSAINPVESVCKFWTH